MPERGEVGELKRRNPLRAFSSVLLLNGGVVGTSKRCLSRLDWL